MLVENAQISIGVVQPLVEIVDHGAGKRGKCLYMILDVFSKATLIS